MNLDFTQLVLLGILCASVHWLIARSEITRPLWSNATGWFGALLACAGCSGWWLGLLAGVLNIAVPVAFYSDGSISGAFGHVAQAFTTAVFGVFVTPIFEAALLWGLRESTLIVEDSAPIPRDQDTIDTPVSNPRRRR